MEARLKRYISVILIKDKKRNKFDCYEFLDYLSCHVIGHSNYIQTEMLLDKLEHPKYNQICMLVDPCVINIVDNVVYNKKINNLKTFTITEAQSILQVYIAYNTGKYHLPHFFEVLQICRMLNIQFDTSEILLQPHCSVFKKMTMTNHWKVHNSSSEFQITCHWCKKLYKETPSHIHDILTSNCNQCGFLYCQNCTVNNTCILCSGKFENVICCGILPPELTNIICTFIDSSR